MNWRCEADKEMTKMSEQHTCELCGQPVEVVSSGEGTNSYRLVESERMAELERLVEDAEHYVSMVALPANRGDWRPGARRWLARYREMFTPEVKK